MITFEKGSYLLVLGLILLLIWVFYKGKNRNVFFLLGVVLIILRMLMKDFTVLKENTKHVYLTFSKTVIYKYSNGEIKDENIGENTVINDSKNKLLIEALEYNSFQSYSLEKNNVIDSLKEFSSKELDYNIDYYFIKPPDTIKIKQQSGTKFLYWIHVK